MCAYKANCKFLNCPIFLFPLNFVNDKIILNYNDQEIHMKYFIPFTEMELQCRFMYFHSQIENNSVLGRSTELCPSQPCMEIYSFEPLQLKTGSGSRSEGYISIHDCDGHSSVDLPSTDIVIYYIKISLIYIIILHLKASMHTVTKDRMQSTFCITESFTVVRKKK